MSLRQLARSPILLHRDPVLLAPRRSFSSQKTTPATTRDVSPPKTPASKANLNGLRPPNPSYPAFSFKDLDMKGGVKFVVIVAISILSVTETIFWTKVLWAKFWPTPSEAESKEVGEEGGTE